MKMNERGEDPGMPRVFLRADPIPQDLAGDTEAGCRSQLNLT